MGVPLLPHELSSAELVVEMAWGSEAPGGEPPPLDWTDMTTYVRHAEPISITAGRSDEADTTQPATCQIRFDNTDASFSLGGDSQFWPNVRRGVPVRVRVPNVVTGLQLPGRDSDSFALSEPNPWTTTGDLDIRIELEPDTWRPPQFRPIASQWVPGSADNMWVLRHHPEGWLELKWSEDGSNAIARFSTPIDADAGRIAVRVTLDLDDGGNYHVRWYTAPSIDGTWTQFYDEVGSGTTTLHPSEHTVSVGALSNGEIEFAGQEAPFEGVVYDLEIRDGIDGALVVDPGFSGADPWPGSFLGDDGLIWGVHNGAEIIGGVLFMGYATGFPPAWNIPATDAVVTMTAAGSLRRLEGRRKPLLSAMSRSIPGQSGLVAYWPMEEGERAGRFESGLPNVGAVLEPRGDVNFSDDGAFPGSAPVPTIDAGSFDGSVPSYVLEDDSTRVTFLLAIPEAGMDDTEDSLIARVRMTGNGYVRWDIHAQPDGSIRTRVYDEFGSEDTNELWDVGFALNGKRGMFSVWFTQNAMAVNLQLAFRELGAPAAGAADHDYPNSTLGVVEGLQLGDRRHSGGASFGQLAVYTGTGDQQFWESSGELMQGWAGETAVERINRLAVENDVYVHIIGDSGVAMGPQPIDTFMNAMRECELADQGVFLDGTGPGLKYITRSMRESVAARVELDASAGTLAPGLEPTHDDENVVNRFTAVQVDGGEATAEQVDGPVGTRALDVHDESRDLNVNAVGVLADYAAWRVHLGTDPGYRYPSAGSNLRASPQLAADWLRARTSSRLDITNARAAFPQIDDDTIRLLVEGLEINIGPYHWIVSAQCSSYDPWRVGIAAGPNGDGAGEFATPADTVESHTAAAAMQGATELDVATVYGPYWGSLDAPYDVSARGHVVTVQAVGEGVYVDTFDRTVSSGWGTADSGQGYVYFAPGGSSDFSVSAGDGLVNLTTADASVLARVLMDPLTYVDHSATVVVPTEAETSAGIWHGLSTAYTDDSNYAFAYLRYLPAEGVVLQLSTFDGGTGATHGDRTIVTSYAAGDQFRIRVRKAGASILTKAWPLGEREPSSWAVGADMPNLAGPGEVGTYAAALSGGSYTLPVQVTYRDMRMHNPQRFTVDPIPADIAAGGPVEVHNPPIAGL